MKNSLRIILLVCFIVGLLALGWARAQTSSHPFRVMVNGVEIRSLMADQQNALVGQLEAAGQTNAVEMFRQYRCAYAANLSAMELGDTVAILQSLRAGDTNQAIQLLEWRLSRYANIMGNSYGGLSPTNRAQVELQPLAQARDYFAKFPPAKWDAEMEKAVNEILRRTNEKPGK